MDVKIFKKCDDIKSKENLRIRVKVKTKEYDCASICDLVKKMS